jgi:hypothetical protein
MAAINVPGTFHPNFLPNTLQWPPPGPGQIHWVPPDWKQIPINQDPLGRISQLEREIESHRTLARALSTDLERERDNHANTVTTLKATHEKAERRFKAHRQRLAELKRLREAVTMMSGLLMIFTQDWIVEHGGKKKPGFAKEALEKMQKEHKLILRHHEEPEGVELDTEKLP